MRPVILIALASLGALAPVRAQSDLDDCEDLLRRDPHDQRSFNCFGIVGRNPAFAGAAEARLRGMASVAPDDPRPQLGLCVGLMFRDSTGAETACRRAVELAAVSGDPALEGWARWGLMIFFGARGRSDDSQEEWVRAEALAREAGDHALIANVVIDGANGAAFVRSELSQGYHALRRLEAEPWFASLPPRIRTHHAFVIGLIASRFGDFAQSYRYGKQAAELAEASGDRMKLENGLSAMAQAVMAGPVPGVDREEAVAAARRALELALERGSISGEVELRWALANLLDGRESREQLEILQERTRQSPWVRHMTRLVEAAIGSRLLREDPPRPEEALGHFERALDAALRFGSLQDVTSSLADLVLVRLQLGDRDAALAAGMQAMEAVERLEDLQSDTSHGARLLATRSGIYYVLADRLLDDGDAESLDRAFTIAERMRTRRLLRERSAAVEIDPGVLRDIARVQARLMASGLSDEEVVALETELRTLESRAAALPPSPGAPPVDPPSSAEVATALNPDEALLSFLIPPNRSQRGWLWVRTADERHAHPLPATQAIEVAVRFWLGLIEQGDAEEAEAAATLHRMLVEDALTALPPTVRRLILVPDGILHRVPFDALRDAVESPPWITRFETTIAPSASFWLSLRRESPPTEARALLLADPSRGEDQNIPAVWRDAMSLRDPLGPLPHAREEARAAFRCFGGTGRLEVGQGASEALVKQAAGDRYGLMHFAAHAVIDEDVPDRSAVLLAAGSEDEDGLLQAREVRQLDLAGSVVVLSGCRSAAGAIHAGEGVMGLARSFFSARARTVIGGLWPLADRDTSELMQAFYRRVGAGEPVAAAMTGAKRERFEAGAPTAAWAGVVVLGNGDAAFPAMRAALPRWALPLAGLTVLILWLSYRRLRTKAARSRTSSSESQS